MLIFKEIPFAIIRTIFWIITIKDDLDCAYYNISIFFTLKNYLLIIFLINRCYVIFTHAEDTNSSKSCVLENYRSLDPEDSLEIEHTTASNSSTLCLVSRDPFHKKLRAKVQNLRTYSVELKSKQRLKPNVFSIDI